MSELTETAAEFEARAAQTFRLDIPGKTCQTCKHVGRTQMGNPYCKGPWRGHPVVWDRGCRKWKAKGDAP